MKTKYVVGFAFDGLCKRIILIKKEKPAWQIGYYNGIGGKIEPTENPTKAMVREFKEETSIATHKERWHRFVVLNGKSYVVHFFYTHLSGLFDTAKSNEHEKIELINLENFFTLETIPNLKWLVPLAYEIINGGIYPNIRIHKLPIEIFEKEYELNY